MVTLLAYLIPTLFLLAVVLYFRNKFAKELRQIEANKKADELWDQQYEAKKLLREEREDQKVILVA